MAAEFSKIETPEKDRHPYLKKSWYDDDSNFYWRDGGLLQHSQKFIDKMEAFVLEVRALEGGCFLRLISDE